MSTTDSQKLFREPIAIIGSACRFPGNVHSPSQLWKLLLEPIDLRRQVPAERFAGNTFYHPDPSFHGHCNVSSVYPLTEDIRHFDASFFGVKPVEAASIDPQQRLLMEVVYEGLESAGLTIGKLAGSDTGLYVGMMCDDYQTMLSHDHQETPTYMATGIARTMAANRISHFFDWHGPSMILDTACSSSLVAVHLAVQALRAGDCAVALAAGTSLLLGPEFFISESKLNMLSPQGQSRMWDKAADGYARGEGVATVVLKPLRAALADGDHIECVIRDIDINQDGRTPGLTMPSSAAQTALIKEVYRKAGLDASLPQDRCQYFEAHGTGTPAGDPVEAKAIFDAFFGAHGIVATTNEDRPLLVGSIKTILGHTEGTAGLAGMLKASLALQHELIPQNMQLDELNPAIVPFSTHLKVPTRNMLWPEVPSGQPRRASVNSFGFGGTNCHAILESAPLACMGSESRVSFAPFCFSAQSRHSLLRNLAIHATFLEEHPDINPADLAWTLRSRRSALPYRLCFAASSIVDLRANIGNFLLLATLDQDAVIRSVTPVLATIPRKSTRIFGVFTGQGAQYARMGAELIEQSAYCAEVIDSLDNILSSLPAEDRPTWTLRDELLQDANPARIHEAGLSQPLCTAIQIILVKLLQLAGIKLTAVVGHSSGEIGAAFAAGIISTRDAIRIAYYRGRYASLAMGPTGKSGAMLTVGTSWEDAQDLCSWDEFAGKIVVAASNSPSSVTLAGDEDALAHIDLILDDEKKFRRWLKVDKAYHSPHMRPCSSPYLCALQRCSIQPSFSEPKCVWVSSVDPDSKAAAPPGVEGPYWNENMLHPVRFMHAIESTLSRVGSFDLAIEIGPHPALMGPVMDTVQKHLPNGLPYTGTLYRGKSALTSLKDALLFLHSNMEDGELDWDTLDTYLGGTTTFTTVPDLPTYQWNHDRKYWHNSPYLRRLLHKRHTVHPILGDISPESSPHQLRWRNVLRPSEIPWICHHRLQSQAVFPAAGYIVAALDAAMILAHDRKRPVQLVEIKNMAIHQALAFSSDHDPGVEVVFSVDERHQGQHPESITAGFASSSSLHDHETLQPVASAEITFFFGPPELNILPAPEKNQMQMCRVASEQFYKSLEALGYDYTGAFKGLFSLQRRLGYSSGLLAVPKPEQYEINPFLIHPAVLDMSIQALLLAYSHPNDGRLRSLFVPTTIETVRINPFDLQNATLEHHELSVRATLADRQRHPIEILGDVELTDPTGHHLSVQIHGIRAVPFVSPTSANDRQMFARMHWVSATVDAEAVAANTCPDPDDYKLAEILERASCFYLRQVHRQVEEIGGDIDREGLVASYSRFARNVTTLVAQGKYPYGLREWMDDELEDIMAMTAP
jgi:hybrid polyketide synthase/nonribosomal peptide synthetase ACE1